MQEMQRNREGAAVFRALAQDVGLPLKLAWALDLMARTRGVRDWRTLRVNPDRAFLPDAAVFSVLTSSLEEWGWPDDDLTVSVAYSMLEVTRDLRRPFRSPESEAVVDFVGRSAVFRGIPTPLEVEDVVRYYPVEELVLPGVNASLVSVLRQAEHLCVRVTVRG